jgi:hypothetical protein
VGGGHQLTTRDAAVLEAGDQQGREVGAGGVDGGGVASGPGTDDDQILDIGSGEAFGPVLGHGLGGMTMGKA